MATEYFILTAILSLFVAYAPAYAQQQNVENPSAANKYVQPVPVDVVAPPIRSLELSAGAEHLNAGYGNWLDTTLRGIYGIGPNVIQAELSSKREFGQFGNFVGIGDTYTINQDWYVSAAVGFGDGAFYLPRERLDVFINRKWLPKRNLVSSIGVGYYNAPDGHIDRSLSLGAAYYFDQPWIIQAGVRFNHSDPGNIPTHQQFVAVTYGRDKKNLVTARYSWGGEGYQAISQTATLVNFQSKEITLEWRHWFSKKSGFLVSVDHYQNPIYGRNGAYVGLFHQF
ncbi:YaiO family outer membrane beta-barrel protein [Pandoraea sp.]|uniref:YaiO family outer membrane beta-barrel protein n=1 Tax=Pandoraea sp. TaxID=1883445 RepID=UPI0012254CF6|nr:YaiO family outer membrane beta-barrel protein [Pandoraea sp.]TAL53517.1 MAG: YaiO family outer membrane beta-barrel protein [Pandoraea sp.]TAM14941.1 MAG: YaiO family outer membrane beta-barrel protein [Pandoraea sp.]